MGNYLSTFKGGYEMLPAGFPFLYLMSTHPVIL